VDVCVEAKKYGECDKNVGTTTHIKNKNEKTKKSNGARNEGWDVK